MQLAQRGPPQLIERGPSRPQGAAGELHPARHLTLGYAQRNGDQGVGGDQVGERAGIAEEVLHHRFIATQLPGDISPAGGGGRHQVRVMGCPLPYLQPKGRICCLSLAEGLPGCHARPSVILSTDRPPISRGCSRVHRQFADSPPKVLFSPDQVHGGISRRAHTCQ